MSFDSLSLLMVCMIKKMCLANRVRNDVNTSFIHMHVRH